MVNNTWLRWMLLSKGFMYKDELEFTGLIYAHYIPIQRIPNINGNVITPSRPIESRYTTKMVDGRYYSTLTVNGRADWVQINNNL